jgi:hypothetical protein
MIDTSIEDFSITDIPNNYYSIMKGIDYLRAGEEDKVTINFLIPENASEGTFSGKFNLFYDGKSKEEIFGFTILSKSEDNGQEEEIDQKESGNSSISKTGKFLLPNIQINLPDTQFFYAIGGMLAFFVGSFTLKKIKKKKELTEDNEIGKVFSEIKSQIREKDDNLSDKKS